MSDEVVQMISSCKWIPMAEDGSLNLGDSNILMPDDTWLEVMVLPCFNCTDANLSLEL